MIALFQQSCQPGLTLPNAHDYALCCVQGVTLLSQHDAIVHYVAVAIAHGMRHALCLS